MLSVLSQLALPILLTGLGLMGVTSLFWFRQARQRKVPLSAEADETRSCGCHTRCDEHLYQIAEPVKLQR